MLNGEVVLLGLVSTLISVCAVKGVRSIANLLVGRKMID